MRDAASVHLDGVKGIQFDRHTEVLDGALIVAFLAVADPSVQIGVGVSGVEHDGLVTVLDGAIMVAALIVRCAPVVEGPERFVIDAKHLAEILDGPVELALSSVGLASPVKGVAEPGIKPDRAAMGLGTALRPGRPAQNA